MAECFIYVDMRKSQCESDGIDGLCPKNIMGLLCHYFNFVVLVLTGREVSTFSWTAFWHNVRGTRIVPSGVPKQSTLEVERNPAHPTWCGRQQRYI